MASTLFPSPAPEPARDAPPGDPPGPGPGIVSGRVAAPPAPDRPPEPQPVLSPLTTAAVFLVLTVDEGGEETVRDLLGELGGLGRAFGFGAPDAALSCVAGIGSDVWDRLFDYPRPADLHPFQPIEGPRHSAPATPGDLLFHLRATRSDLCFQFASEITKRLRGAVTLQDEVQGFTYLDFRDLLGFVDGTENPVGPAAHDAVLVGDEDPAHAGGSYVIVQKYLHDLDAWNALPVEAQERIIGRTKATNIELDAPGSHVDLNTVTGEDGEERQILRDNMPFGSPGRSEFGTYFIGYARTPAVTELMLDRMFLGVPPGGPDRILDFSTAVTGTLFHTPSADFLDDLPPLPASTAGTAASGQDPQRELPAVPPPDPGPEPAAAGDGSLGIGNLNRSTLP